jgi:twitching motility protein PilT
MNEDIEIFNNLLLLAVENGASDVHVKTNKPAYLRLHGHLEPIDMDAITTSQILRFVESACPGQFLDRWQEDNQIDFSFEVEEVGRFRVNAFHQRGTPTVVFRHVKDRPPTFEELNHDPEVFKKLTLFNDGILLICGATGSGKSSTLAAMMNYLNHTVDRHVVTLEDPIEFNFSDLKCIFNQREVGIDVPNFSSGMRSVLRQDPDVILIGEMRDKETFNTALSAAETGHYVFSTLHSSNAQQAVQRIFEFYPPDEHLGLRRQVASTLRAIVTQKLVPALEGIGRVPVVETFVLEGLGRNAITAGNFEKIPAIIEAGREFGSKSFNYDLYRLIREGVITKQVGLACSPNPQALEMNLKGIFLSSGGIVN